VLLLGSLVPNAALAAVRTWDGGGADNKWSTAANWSADTVPTATDIALFDGTGKKDATMDAAFGGAVAELRLAAANTGTITVGRSLTVNGNLSLSGGTLRANGGNTVTVKGSWQNGGAIFDAGTGTVLLTGSGTTYVLKETGAFKHLSLNDGMVGYWKFDEGAGTMVTESMGNVIPGVFELDPVWTHETPDVNFETPYSLLFNGTPQQRVLLESISSPYRYDIQTGDMTVSVWVKKTDASNGGRVIARDQCGDHSLWEIQGNADGTYHVRMKGSNFASTGNVYSSVHPINVWLMLTLVKTSTRLSIYVNGILEGTATHALSFSANTQAELYVGNRKDCQPAASFAGYIDDIRLYSRALSSSEIQALYSGEQGTGSGRYTLGSNLTVNGNLNIYSGTLDPSSNNYAITASGSFVNNAGFTPRNSTVTLSGIGTHLKTYGTSIYNLAIAASKSAILRAGAVISNALTINSTASLRLNGFTMTGTTATITNAGALTQGTGALIHRNSSISVSPASAAMGTTFAVTVTDADANIDGLVADTVSIGTDSETIVLTETGIATGIFTGTIPTAYGPRVANNGIVDRNDECTFTTGVWYSDPQDPPDSVSTTFVVTGCASSSASTTPTNGGGGARAKARIERGGTPALAPVTSSGISSFTAPTSPRMLAIQRRLAELDMKLAKATRSDERQTLERARQTLQRMLQRLRATRR
jgi:hypothetical protein